MVLPNVKIDSFRSCKVFLHPVEKNAAFSGNLSECDALSRLAAWEIRVVQQLP